MCKTNKKFIRKENIQIFIASFWKKKKKKNIKKINPIEKPDQVYFNSALKPVEKKKNRIHCFVE